MGQGRMSAPAATAAPLLEIEDLRVHFPLRRGLFGRAQGAVRAVDGVSLSMARGETLGLVGESGCGKSTLGNAILRIVEPSGGAIRLGGVDLARLEGEALRAARRKAQMVFQDPFASLDPRMRLGESIGEPLLVHGLARGRCFPLRFGLRFARRFCPCLFEFPYGLRARRLCFAFRHAKLCR